MRTQQGTVERVARGARQGVVIQITSTDDVHHKPSVIYGSHLVEQKHK